MPLDDRADSGGKRPLLENEALRDDEGLTVRIEKPLQCRSMVAIVGSDEILLTGERVSSPGGVGDVPVLSGSFDDAGHALTLGISAHLLIPLGEQVNRFCQLKTEEERFNGRHNVKPRGFEPLTG